MSRLIEKGGLEVLSIDAIQVFIHYALAELFLGRHLYVRERTGLSLCVAGVSCPGGRAAVPARRSVGGHAHEQGEQPAEQ